MTLLDRRDRGPTGRGLRTLSATILTATLALTLTVVPRGAAPIASAGTARSEPKATAAAGNTCSVIVLLKPTTHLGTPLSAGVYLTLARDSKWDTDSWDPSPPHMIGEPGKPYGIDNWSSVGGFGRGCHNEVRYNWHGSCGGHPCEGTVTFSVTYHHHGEIEDSCTHTGENPRCESFARNRHGDVYSQKWRIIGPPE